MTYNLVYMNARPRVFSVSDPVFLDNQALVCRSLPPSVTFTCMCTCMLAHGHYATHTWSYACACMYMYVHTTIHIPIPTPSIQFYSPYSHSTLFETDERFKHLGFDIIDLGCCKCIRHPLWGPYIFVGTLFTDAPVTSPVVTSIMEL